MRKNLKVIIFSILLIIAGAFTLVLFEEKRLEEIDDGVVAYKNSDYENAIKILAPYADQGYEAAESTLADAYLHGLGVEKNRDIAKEWMKKHKGKDVVKTYLWVAKSYENGEHRFTKDIAEAIEWYKFAEIEGSKEAEKKLYELTKR